MKNTLKVLGLAFVTVLVFSTVSCTGSGGKTLNSAEDLKAYLEKQPANSPDKPIRVNMNANAPMLPNIVAVINSAGKYVSLNLSGNVLTTIPNRAFANRTLLTAITIPDSVTSLGEEAFSNCTGLANITIGNGVTSIGISAFAGCTSLASVTIPDSVTIIGSGAFNGCTSLTSVTIGNSVTIIGSGAFKRCASLTSVTIGNSVTSLGEEAFSNCTGLANVTIPDSVTSIGSSAFNGCTSLASVTMSNSVDVIHGGMFSNTGLPNLPLPKSADTSGSSGGKIFYYSKAGFTMTDNKQICHYLEAAPADMSGKLAWASSSYTRTNISGTETGIGTGRKNTAVILTTDAAAPAAKACKEYNYGGKTDWFLPSRDEMNILYLGRNYVGGLSNTYYWSSSLDSYGDAWLHSFSSGGQGSTKFKDGTDSVRAVRAF